MNVSYNLKNILFLIFLIFNSIFPNQIGQHFILSLPENANKEKLSSWIEQTKPAGIMLAPSHFTQREKTKALITFIQKKAKDLGLPPLFIAVDWEGGIISRPNETGGFFSVPSPWALASSGRNSCFLAGMLIGHQLRNIGVNMNFAPSLDLFDPQNQILATRCFSANPEITAECGIAFAKGLLSQGVLPVIKHFPGLGIGKGDTHFAEVGINIDGTEFNKITTPFKQALEEEIPCIMSTHASFKQFQNIPTTLSSKAVQFLTSKNPNTLLITDDFCMKAIQKDRSIEEAIIQSLQAGYHLIIFSGKPEKQISLIQKLQKNLSNSKILDTSFIDKFKKEHLTKKAEIDLINEQNLACELAKQCISSNKIIPSLNNKNILMFSVNLSKIRTPEKWFIQKNHSFLGIVLANLGIENSEYIIDPLNERGTDQIDELLATAKQASYILLQTFFYADNKWNKIQRQWLEKFKDYQSKLIVVSLGHPLENEILPDAHIINLGSFHKPLLNRVAQILTQKEMLTGADQLIKNTNKYLQNKNFGLLCHRASTVIQNGETKFLPDVLYEWTKGNSLKKSRSYPSTSSKPSRWPAVASAKASRFGWQAGRTALIEKTTVRGEPVEPFERKIHSRAKLAALFCPEHGLLGSQEAGAKVESEIKSPWECPIYSLHGKDKKPTPEMLKNLDLIVVDLQEVGVRCFTYLSSLQLMLESAKQHNIPVIVLDRPNPLIELGAQGPMLEEKYESFLGKLYTKFLHGSTIGSLAKKINTKIGTQLTVISCNKTTKDLFFERKFIPPSPNLKSIDHIYAYPMTVFIEGTNYSEGRGTNYPFLQIGAPWVDENLLAKILNDKKLAGICFEPITFTPQKISGVADNPKHANQLCHGVFLHIYDLHNIKPTKNAKAILQILFLLYPEKSELLRFQNKYNLDLLVGKDSWRKKILKTMNSI